MVEAALALIAAAEAEGEEFPWLRAGLATGPTLPQSGDYYGRAVNLASRDHRRRPARQRRRRRRRPARPPARTASPTPSSASAGSRASTRGSSCSASARASELQ